MKAGDHVIYRSNARKNPVPHAGEIRGRALRDYNRFEVKLDTGKTVWAEVGELTPAASETAEEGKS